MVINCQKKGLVKRKQIFLHLIVLQKPMTTKKIKYAFNAQDNSVSNAYMMISIAIAQNVTKDLNGMTYNNLVLKYI